MAYDDKLAQRMRALLDGRKDTTELSLMGGICFMVNGNMCCSASGRGGLMVRVGPDAHDRMVREPHTTAVEMGSRTMKGYVRVAPEGYRTESALKTWLMRGVDFASTLKRKAAKKAKRKLAKAGSAKKNAKKRAGASQPKKRKSRQN